MNRIVLATHNAHKAREFRRLLPDHVEVLTLDDIGWTKPIEEPYPTFAGNARAKALAIFSQCRIPALADDSGLEIDWLGGRPGVRSARYAGPRQDDAQNLLKVISELQGITDRRARFRAVLAFCPAADVVHYFEGSVEGTISLQPEGSGGFGYDPIFIPDGFTNTFGILPAEVKNRISHRARAFQKFIAFLNSGNTAG